MGGLTSLLLLLCVGVTVSTVLDLQKRIIGGHDCPKDERVYHVKFIRENGKLICGGSLLENNWILTAAHCWEWGMKAVLGEHPGTQPITMLITAAPVMYDDTENGIHDIMLLKLPTKGIPSQIKPVELPKGCKNKPKPRDTVKIAGYTATTIGEDNGRVCDPSPKLQCADIKLSDCKKLKDIMDSDHLRSYNNWFCGETSTVDICPGDSGGGVVVGNTINGVISFMGDGVKANAQDVGFMEVCEYVNWIKKTTKRRKLGWL